MDSNITALILAGGKNSRMGGIYKGSLQVENQTILEHLVKEMKKATDQIFLSYGEKIHMEMPGCEIILDEEKNCGPLGGLYTALKRNDRELLFVSACDMPCLSMKLYKYLLQEIEKKQGVVPIMDKRAHPLAAIYRKDIFPVVEAQIRKKKYRFTEAIEQMNILYLDVSDQKEFRKMLENVNTIEEYKNLIHR